jgi:hypothetical protein
MQFSKHKAKFIFKFVTYEFQDVVLKLFIVCFQKACKGTCSSSMSTPTLHFFFHPSFQLELVIHDSQFPIK